MLGIEDKGVLAAYLLCLVSAGLCVLYGVLNWNRGDETVNRTMSNGSPKKRKKIKSKV